MVRGKVGLGPGHEVGEPRLGEEGPRERGGGVEHRSDSIKKALTLLVSAVVALEVKAEHRLPDGAWVLAWARLLKIYGALRMDVTLAPKERCNGDAGFFRKADPNKILWTREESSIVILVCTASLGVAVTDWLCRGYELRKQRPRSQRVSSDLSTFVPKLASTNLSVWLVECGSENAGGTGT